MAFSTLNQPSLADLPADLIEMIAEPLDLATLCSLRLTCKILSQRSSGPHFKSFFSHQQTDLSPRSLRRICNIASNLLIGPAVQSLVVLAVIYDTSELDRMLKTKQRRRVFEKKGVFSMTTSHQAKEDELHESRRTREQLLARQAEQASMAQNGSYVQLLADALLRLGKLRRLAVEAIVNQGLGERIATASAGEWHPVWVRATQIYRTVTLAIAHSGAAIECLQIYRDSKKCSVPTWDINEHMPALESKNFARAAEHIKSLTLSVSTKMETDYQKILDARANMSEVDRAFYEAGMGTQAGLLSEDDPTAVAEENYPGVARLLKHMPNLEHLELHLYKTLRGVPKSYARVLSCIADSVALLSLRHCTLRGLRSDEASLLQFLRVHNALDTLELHEVSLVTGSWKPVFSHLCAMPTLQQVTLSSIREPEIGLMNLTCPIHLKEERDAMMTAGEESRSYPCVGGEHVHTRVISRDQMLRERFDFEVRGYYLGSYQFMMWVEGRKAEYGAP